MKKNGYTAIEMLTVIIVLGIFTLVMVFGTSNAYKDRSVDYFHETEHIIEKQAMLYGKTLNELKNDGTIVITLQDLVDKGYYVADSKDGNVVDPRNTKHLLNGLKIKISKSDNGEIKAKIIEED